jgi:DNA polymerase-3 subunit delta
MKPAETRLRRALDTADPAIRFYLLYGPDEAASRALADRLGAALGPDCERIDLSSSALKADPARLADEAASISLFGGRRWIRIEPATDEALPAIEALLEAAAAGNPVAAVAGALRKDAKLLKLLQSRDDAIAHISYLPEGRDADALAVELARDVGLRCTPDVARRLANTCGADRAILSRELDKYALYLDADPERPKTLEQETLDALGAASEEGDLGKLTAAVFGGQPQAAEAELARLASEGVEGIGMLRALGRRALQLAQLRAQVAEGDSVERVMDTAGKAIFWKERDATSAALRRWTPDGLATAMARIAAAERRVKTPGFAGNAVVEQDVLAIARFAARRR